MSNARSPREVCSTTIGIFGLIGFSFLLGAGGPQLVRFLRLLLLFLLRRPNRLAGFGLLGRDRLDVGGNPVNGLLQAQIGANAIGAAVRDELLDVRVAFILLAKLGPDLVVGDL